MRRCALRRGCDAELDEAIVPIRVVRHAAGRGPCIVHLRGLRLLGGA